jgi:hypothetical protein
MKTYEQLARTMDAYQQAYGESRHKGKGGPRP